MLIDQLKANMMAAMKAKDTVAKEAMRTAIGEITKTGEEATDERVTTVLRKMVKSNHEALEYAKGEDAENLKRENELLGEFLPKALDVDEVLDDFGLWSDAREARAPVQWPCGPSASVWSCLGPRLRGSCGT